MSAENKEIYEFGEFRLDIDERTIERIDGHKNGTLTEKAFQALALLVRRRGHLVTRNELIEFIWPDTVVEENNLEKCVHHLRQYLGNTPEGSSYVETVRKHGYRFVGKVKAEQVSGSWLPETFRTSDAGGSAPVIPVSLAQPGSKSEGSAKITPPRETRVRVRHSVKVATAVFVIVGTVGGAMYYRSVQNAGVEANGVGAQTRIGTDNAEAYRLYLQGMNLSDERGGGNVLKALGHLENAVALDPNYALAWAGIALLHRDLSNAELGAREHYDKSMAAIDRALAIDPNISDAYSALCHCKNRFEYDAAGAEVACQRAIAIDPASPQAHKTYANLLYSQGRFDESIAEIQIAMKIQPVSYRNQQVYALALYYARRYGQSEEAFRRLLELNPNRGFIHGWLSEVLDAQGRHDEAFGYLINKLKLEKVDRDTIDLFNTAYSTSGWRGVLTQRINTPNAMLIHDSFQLACLHAKVGDKDRAFEHLEKAYQARSFWIAVLQVTPQLDGLRDDPRYADLVRRVNEQS